MVVPTPGISQILAQVTLGTGATLIYEPPASPPNLFVRVTALWMCNSDSATRALTLRYGTPSPLTAANNLLGGAPIQANTTYIAFEGMPIDVQVGYRFEGFGSVADKFVVTVWGYVWRGS